MWRNALFQLLLGGAISGFGGFMYEVLRLLDMGGFVVNAGAVYGFAAFALTLLGFKLPSPLPREDFSFIENRKIEKQLAVTEERLLRCKKMLDAGILTQEEYNEQAIVLKEKIRSI